MRKQQSGFTLLELIITIMLILLFVVVASGLGWFGRANHAAQERVFAPIEEATRYDTFKYSQAFRDSATNDIAQLQREYNRASSPDAKAAIAAQIRRQAATMPYGTLPPELNGFVQSVINSSN